MNRTLLVCLCLAGSAFAQRVPWTYETPNIPSNQSGDPAFMLAPGPMVVGTDTNLPNLFFWQLGQPAFSLTVGPVNSADARGPLLAVASSNTNSVLFFTGSDAGFTQLSTGGFTVATPRHVALRQAPNGTFELYVDTSSQTIEHHVLDFANGTVTFLPLLPIQVAEAPSGIAVDDRTGDLYVAQPSLGVVLVPAGSPASFLLSIDAGRLGSTVGGVDLFLMADGGTIIFTTAPNEGEIKAHSGRGLYLNKFTVGDIDGGNANLSTPQFLDVYGVPVPGFPRGVLVVQDQLTSNYKVLSLADVDTVVPLPRRSFPRRSCSMRASPLTPASPTQAWPRTPA